MHPFRHVAVLYAGHPTDELGIATAAGLAGDGVRLSVVHVTPRPLLVEEVDGEIVARPDDIAWEEARQLERRAAEIPGAEPVVLEGLPGPAICEWARGCDVDLIVAVPVHEGLSRVVAGSLTRHLVENAPCSVLVVRAAPG